MYCIKCGVKLNDTEKECPLCNTKVYHPDVEQKEVKPLYPNNRMPLNSYSRKALCGMIIILYLIPLVTCFYSDFYANFKLDWFFYVLGSLLLSYEIFARPLWFKKPNPVIFVPCGFAIAILFLLYINVATNGNWFLSFAFPVVGGLGLIISALVTLLRYIKKGRLYIFGGALVLFGLELYLVEFLLNVTFDITFLGWSIYPLIVLSLIGGLLIYLGINTSLRRVFERKLFF